MLEKPFDCLFCVNRYSTMEKLFAHVESNHRGMSKAESDQAVRLHFARKEKKEKAMEDMIPSASTGKDKKSPAGSSAFNPFLKAHDIGKKVGAKAKLMLLGTARVNTEGRFGAQINVGVKFNGSDYDMSVKIGSANHRIIEESFGRNPKKWKGKKIAVEIKNYMNNNYIAITK